MDLRFHVTTGGMGPRLRHPVGDAAHIRRLVSALQIASTMSCDLPVRTHVKSGHTTRESCADIDAPGVARRVRASAPTLICMSQATYERLRPAANATDRSRWWSEPAADVCGHVLQAERPGDRHRAASAVVRRRPARVGSPLPLLVRSLRPAELRDGQPFLRAGTRPEERWRQTATRKSDGEFTSADGHPTRAAGR